MGRRIAARREGLHAGLFAYIDMDGERHLPINDDNHVRDAISRFDQTVFEDTIAKHAAARKIISAAKHHDIEVDKTSDVAKPIKR